ncbi:hypothetical protein BBP40_010156 [Aspergillus hancockii]|nr:hypothetical protein BBP40_010156 [Aspergillus hancockii]
MASVSFSPEKDIPNLSGKVILITGGTAGLGAAAAIHLAKHSPAHIYISGRNAKSADAVIQQAQKSGNKVSFLACDLASLDSVNKAAETILAQESRLDLLMCNAGIMAVPPGKTKDGYEVQFGTNHLGHALLIQKCLPLLQQTAALPGIVFSDLKSEQNFSAFGGWIRYGQSKLANILYARELARRYPSITSVSAHPGVVGTGFVENLGWANRAFVYVTNMGKLMKPEEGAYNQLWASTTPKESLKNGQFYEPVGILSSKLDKVSKDDALAKQLWEWTDKALADYVH